jgi:hypothetical protein
MSRADARRALFISLLSVLLLQTERALPTSALEISRRSYRSVERFGCDALDYQRFRMEPTVVFSMWCTAVEAARIALAGIVLLTVGIEGGNLETHEAQCSGSVCHPHKRHLVLSGVGASAGGRGSAAFVESRESESSRLVALQR